MQVCTNGDSSSVHGLLLVACRPGGLELYLLVVQAFTTLLAYNLVFIVFNDLATGQWLVSHVTAGVYFIVLMFITGNREDSWSTARTYAARWWLGRVHAERILLSVRAACSSCVVLVAAVVCLLLWLGCCVLCFAALLSLPLLSG